MRFINTLSIFICFICISIDSNAQDFLSDFKLKWKNAAEYTMEFSRYAPVPAEVHQELVKKYGTGLIADDEE